MTTTPATTAAIASAVVNRRASAEGKPHCENHVQRFARALKGDVVGRNRVAAPGPGHSAGDRSLSITLDPNASDGFVVHSFAGDDWRICRDHVRRALGTPASRWSDNRPAPQRVPISDAARRAGALSIWHSSCALSETLGERYLAVHRGLDLSNLPDLAHVMRWNSLRQCIVALMTDPVTAQPTGVHRTFLNADASKRERKMLGKSGIVRLSPDDSVTLGLGLSEGIEDGLSVMASGWSPIWAACSAGSVGSFPALPGIEALTVFADADSTGMTAARACVARWRAADREACIVAPSILEARS